MAYLIQGLPSDLTNQEISHLKTVLPSQLKDSSPLEPSQAKRRGPSLLHRSLASTIIAMCLLLRLALPYIRLFVAKIYSYDRAYHIRERVFAFSVTAANSFGKRSTALASTVITNDIVMGVVTYWVDGICGGLNEGLGEGMKIIKAQNEPWEENSQHSHRQSPACPKIQLSMVFNRHQSFMLLPSNLRTDKSPSMHPWTPTTLFATAFLEVGWPYCEGMILSCRFGHNYLMYRASGSINGVWDTCHGVTASARFSYTRICPINSDSSQVDVCCSLVPHDFVLWFRTRNNSWESLHWYSCGGPRPAVLRLPQILWWNLEWNTCNSKA